MSIRLRTIDGRRVALCAARCAPEHGDVYLNDGDHHALTIKFRRDLLDIKDEPEVGLMEEEECEHLACVHPSRAIAADGSLVCRCKDHRGKEEGNK